MYFFKRNYLVQTFNSLNIMDTLGGINIRSVDTIWYDIYYRKCYLFVMQTRLFEINARLFVGIIYF